LFLHFTCIHIHFLGHPPPTSGQDLFCPFVEEKT
jgi:hypothetical protein